MELLLFMSILNSKWMIALFLIVLALIIMSFTGQKSFHSEIIINASTEKVWSVLMDTQRYREWNPVLIPIEGKLEPGAKVKYEFHQDENSTTEIPSRVKKIIPGKLLNQGGGITGILRFDHRYILEAMDDKTKVTIHEDYRGIWVNFWNAKPVEKAYDRLNRALKENVEC